MNVSQETREKLQKQIDALQRRMREDANDLEYETHLQRMRALRRVLDRLSQLGAQAAARRH